MKGDAHHGVPGSSGSPRWAWSIAGGVASLVLLAFAVYDRATLKDRSLSDLIDRSVAGHGSAVERKLIVGRVHSLHPFSFEIGIYLALLAGLLGVAGALAVASALRSPSLAVEASPEVV